MDRNDNNGREKSLTCSFKQTGHTKENKLTQPSSFCFCSSRPIHHCKRAKNANILTFSLTGKRQAPPICQGADRTRCHCHRLPHHHPWPRLCCPLPASSARPFSSKKFRHRRQKRFLCQSRCQVCWGWHFCAGKSCHDGQKCPRTRGHAGACGPAAQENHCVYCYQWW